MLDKNQFEIYKERSLNKNTRFKSVRPILKNEKRLKYIQINDQHEDATSK
jgi:hypothetical protein